MRGWLLFPLKCNMNEAAVFCGWDFRLLIYEYGARKRVKRGSCNGDDVLGGSQ